tara:strand:- start:1189 stop:2244 length:1056 start_codon:yes stop_codon:yes gene_type:complete
MKQLLITIAAVLLAGCASIDLMTKEGLADAPQVQVSNVRKVFDNSHHNAFTDLTVFKGVYYLSFRSCPDGHGVSPNASVVILASKDTSKWEQVHTFSVPKRDTRDPHFLVFKDRLFVYTGTWYSGNDPAESNNDLELNLHLGYAAFSENGTKWSNPVQLDGTFGHYVWRAASFGEKAFLCGRRKIGFEVGPKGEPKEIESLMLESDDGLIWRKRATFQEIDGDETAFLFDKQGGVQAIGRRWNTAQLLQSKPPYTKWTCRDLDRHIGGPLISKWGDRTIVGGRHSTKRGPKTSMCWLVGSKLHEFAELPSGGDNSYPGFVAITPMEALVSWYSSHEGNASIYMANLKIKSE